jgi:neutral ceramidase
MRAILLLFMVMIASAADYRAGVAKVDITPDGPIWLSGYAARTRPSEGVLNRIWAKALALEDRKGSRVVIVTTDLIGLPRAVTDVVGARVSKEYGIERSRVLINSSHTHTGPVVFPNLFMMYFLDPDQERVAKEYGVRLADHLVSVVGAAFADLKPANVSYGSGTVDFAANRRVLVKGGPAQLNVNPQGPVDHSVPVLRITGEKGEVRGVLFGYACHNTTLTAEHHKISGDYAGVAQAEIEKSVPGATALFLELCGGDQNPNPRSEESLVFKHGGALAAEVKRVLDGKVEPVRGEIRAAMQWRDLPLQPHAREDFEKMLGDKDRIRVKFAQTMIRSYDERRPMRSVSYPVQAMRIGRDTVIVALGGEPVVGYALQTKAAHPKLRLVVAGYSNDVMGYIPTAKMLDEGGYEPINSGMYYGLAAPFTKEVEPLVLETINSVIARVVK